MTTAADPDHLLVRRAARSVAIRVSVATAVVLLGMSMVVFQLGRMEALEGTGGEQSDSPSATTPRGAATEGDGLRDAGAVLNMALVTLLGGAAAGAVGWVGAHRAGRPLAAALTLQRRFVADASHELRTPITILHARAQLLQRQTHDDALRPTIDQLVADSRALGDIVTDLLLAAELDAASVAPVDLPAQDLFEQVARSFAVLADRAGIVVVVVPSDVVVRGSPTPLVRAVSCLVDNALAHGRPGGTVTLAARRGPRTVQLVVTDDGEGLPVDRAHLMERFTRGHDTRRGAPRFGLGLALAHEVAAAHGGSLALDDAPGGGAVATLEVPG